MPAPLGPFQRRGRGTPTFFISGRPRTQRSPENPSAVPSPARSAERGARSAGRPRAVSRCARLIPTWGAPEAPPPGPAAASCPAPPRPAGRGHLAYLPPPLRRLPGFSSATEKPLSPLENVTIFLLKSSGALTPSTFLPLSL